MVRIYDFIKRVGIGSRDELAKRLGVSRKTVDSWATGARNPTHEMDIQLYELGITTEELFGYPYPSTAAPRSELKDVARELLEEIKEELKNER
jgi:transcriptional regulator with XRE-family HTH domain